MSEENNKTQIGMSESEMINVMYSVKPLHKLPVIDSVTLQTAAEYFEVKICSMRSYFKNHYNKIREYGTKLMYCSDFENAGYNTEAAGKGKKRVWYQEDSLLVTNRGIRCLSEEAMLFIALNMQNSKVAQNIRDAIMADPCLVTENDIKSDDVLCEEEFSCVEEPGDEDIIMDDEASDDESGGITLLDNGSDVVTFQKSEFGSVRVLLIENEPYFVLKDVCAALDLGSPHKVAERLDEDEKGRNQIPTLGGLQEAIIINESGLYSVILRSDKPEAKKFRKWVTSEVLPSIRKHGAYMTPETIEQVIMNPDFIIKLAEELKMEQQKNMELTAALSEEQDKTANLTVTNKALSDGINTWQYRSLINALIRAYGNKCWEGQFGYAFSEYYRQLKYKYHIDLKIRKAKAKKSTHMIDLIREDEIENAIKLAIAICENSGINSCNIINSVNAEKYGECS